jgi:hypothetical protein
VTGEEHVSGIALIAVADTGSVTAAIAVANTSRTRVYELRKADPAFASAWQEAEETATEGLEDEARRRAVEGIEEPLVSAGKLVRDKDGQPILVRATRITCSWGCSKRAGRRGAKGGCASNCRHFKDSARAESWPTASPRVESTPRSVGAWGSPASSRAWTTMRANPAACRLQPHGGRL